MKILEIALEDIKIHLRLDTDEDDIYVMRLFDTAKAYIRDYTGMSDDLIEEKEGLGSVALMITADLYENRTTLSSYSTQTSGSTNKIYESILSMHSINLL